MMRLVKRRLEDTFRTGQKTGFRNLFRLWLNWTGAGICRTGRTEKPRDIDLAEQQATEPDRGVPCPEPGSIAWESPGSVALYLLLKKRSEQTDSDKTAEDAAARSVADSASGKAVQE